MLLHHNVNEILQELNSFFFQLVYSKNGFVIHHFA